MARLRIGLIGWGTVGSALGRLVAAGPLPLELACLADLVFLAVFLFRLDILDGHHGRNRLTRQLQPYE